ncbi:hypothetical protein [Aerococcus sp.]|uniref:hypothetical protein n=1 Tax=Aerococcus sp. TaxID=1872398 RepID=UPI0028ADD0D3|nr:hypothetical protein [Aerococcus sp.]
MEEDDEKIVSFNNGMVPNELTISDEMFEHPLLRDKDDGWQAIFGVNTISSYRKRRLAAKLMNYVIQDVDRLH